MPRNPGSCSPSTSTCIPPPSRELSRRPPPSTIPCLRGLLVGEGRCPTTSEGAPGASRRLTETRNCGKLVLHRARHELGKLVLVDDCRGLQSLAEGPREKKNVGTIPVSLRGAHAHGEGLVRGRHFWKEGGKEGNQERKWRTATSKQWDRAATIARKCPGFLLLERRLQAVCSGHTT